MGSKLESTKSFMLSKGIQIETRNSWLQNCVQWFVEENSTASLNELHTFVYDQFLLADLRDVELNCLPTNVLNQEKLMLTGKYTLQIDSMQDISQSCYSQIQIIRGTGKNLNVENQDARSRNHAEGGDYNTSRNHMLKLNMTDGVQHVFGMEYETLGEIRGGFIPGCKVVISGPIEVRRGVFFLKAQNFHLLGGELDSLIVQNSIENVLARALNLEENPDPGPMNILADLTNNTAALTQSTQNSILSRPLPGGVNIGNNDTRNHPTNQGNRNTTNSSYQSTNTSHSSYQSSNTHTNSVSQTSITNANNHRSVNTNSNSRFQNDNHWPPESNATPCVGPDDWEDDDDLMDMEVWNSIESSLPPNLPPPSITGPTSHSTSRPPASSNINSSTSIPSSSGANLARSNPSFSSGVNPSSNPTSTSTPSSSANSTLSNHLAPPPSSTSSSHSNLKRYPSPDLTPPAKRQNTTATSDRSNPSTSTTSHTLTPPLEASTSHSLPSTSNAPPILPSSPSRMTLKRIKVSPPPPPFSMVFRGCRVHSVEKLSVSKGAWKLPATISDDGTEFLSVDFSDAVIFNISGVSAAELQSKKKQVTTDPELRKSIEQMVQNIRSQILSYEGSMKISFTATAKPTVVSLPK